jgi:hypothetical protein
MSESESLAQRQAQLVAALIAGGPLPEGVDAGAVIVLGGVLLAKRKRGLRYAAPMVPAVLGPRFERLFAEYAQFRALPQDETATEDAIQFLRWLRRTAQLPSELKYAVVTMRMRRWFDAVQARRRRARG